jgi:hypothetical protein
VADEARARRQRSNKICVAPNIAGKSGRRRPADAPLTNHSDAAFRALQNPLSLLQIQKRAEAGRKKLRHSGEFDDDLAERTSIEVVEGLG